jgi:hypothetical protein
MEEVDAIASIINSFLKTGSSFVINRSFSYACAYICIIVCKYGSFFKEKQFYKMFYNPYGAFFNNYMDVCDKFEGFNYKRLSAR